MIWLLTAGSLHAAPNTLPDLPAISQSVHPAVSPDRTHVVYAVKSLPAGGRDELGGRPQGWGLADGTPFSFRGSALFVVESRPGAEPRRISPAYAWAPTWSPDSRRIAYFSNEGGSVRLWTYDLATQTRHRVLDRRLFARFSNRDGACWSKDGAKLYIAVVTADQGLDNIRPNPYSREQAAYRYAFSDNDPSVKTSAIAEIDVRDGSNTLLPTAGPLNFLRTDSLSPSGRFLVTLTDDFTLNVISLSDRKLRAIGPIQPLIVDSHIGPSDLFAGPYWAPDGDRLAFLSLAGRPSIVDLSVGLNTAPRELAPNLRQVKWGRNNALAFSVDGQTLAGPVLVDDRLQLAAIPLDGNDARLIPILAGLARRNITVGDAVGGPAGVDVLRVESNRLWQPGAHRAFLQYLDGGTAEVVLVDVDWSAGTHREAKRLHAKFSIVGHGPAVGQTLVGWEEFQARRNFFTWSHDLDRGTGILPVPPPDPSLQGVRLDTFSTPVPDLLGVFRSIATSVVRPPVTRGEAKGAVVAIYPGNLKSTAINGYAGGDAATIPLTAFRDHGYSVVLADIVRYPIVLGLKGEIVRPQSIVGSLLPQIYRAADKGLLDVERVAVLGHSQGGLAALEAVSYSGLFRAAIGLSGVRYAPFMDTISYTYNTDPANFTARLAEALVAPAANASQIHACVFLAHGESDPSIGASEIMAEALRHAGKKVEFVHYPGEAHTYDLWTPAHRADVTQRILDFLDKCLATKSPLPD